MNRSLLFTLCVAVALTACASPSPLAPAYSQAQMTQLQAALTPPDSKTGEAYCTRTGGHVQVRYAWFTVSGKLVKTAASAPFCHYRAKDKSTIDISIATLYATRPTIAALAYYAELPMDKYCRHQLSNPAVCYCQHQLYGADFWGQGYWLAAGQNPTQATPFCVFSDFSVIDSWGLTYHSAKIVRGIDLSTVLRYHP